MLGSSVRPSAPFARRLRRQRQDVQEQPFTVTCYVTLSSGLPASARQRSAAGCNPRPGRGVAVVLKYKRKPPELAGIRRYQRSALADLPDSLIR